MVISLFAVPLPHRVLRAGERGWLPLAKRPFRSTEILDPDRGVHELQPHMLLRDACIVTLHVRQPVGPAEHQTLGTSQLIGTQLDRRQRGTLRNDRPAEAWTDAAAPAPARTGAKLRATAARVRKRTGFVRAPDTESLVAGTGLSRTPPTLPMSGSTDRWGRLGAYGLDHASASGSRRVALTPFCCRLRVPG